ncbi:MAG: TIGR01777 family protein [Spirochaetes bacterium RBG_13_51_14]|nr:MAG: TIGR01777 family protein [Spirochaetes bacterium RBG_13_51_14]
MNIFLTGGLGFVGSKLTSMLVSNGHSVTVVERNPAGKQAPFKGIRVITADASRPGPWQDAVAEQDAVINLAGVSIFTRWNRRTKEGIYNSRILITRNVVDALKKRKGKKVDLISASAVGFYGFHGDEFLTESGTPGHDFLARVCRDWEEEALKAEQHGARVVITRFGVILGRDGGALDILRKIFQFRLGNRLGSGGQWFSWIHEDDLVSIFRFILERKNVRGPVNCTAPHPATNRELTGALNRALGTFPLVPPAPGFMLKTILGEFGDFLLKGQRVIPRRLSEAGFNFEYPDIDKALSDLCSDSRPVRQVAKVL